MKRLEALATISTQGKPINGLFRLLETPMLWDAAYATIYANAGALTAGVSSVTLDGFSEERVTAMITRLKTGMYRPQPTRRTFGPKANGKKRPLGISIWVSYCLSFQGIFGKPTGGGSVAQSTTRLSL
jgi:RNA-directed DNA polymerase